MPSKPRRLVSFDWAMKNILRHKANFDIVEGFLTSLLGEEIRIDAILESEGNKNSVDEKNNRVDMKCRDSQNREIIIEIQAQYEFDYLQRILFGTSKAVVEHVIIGEEYQGIPKIISVNILYHALIPNVNKDYLYHGMTDIRGVHTDEPMMVRRGAELLPEQSGDLMPEYYFLCVGNFKDDKAKEKIDEKIDEWMYFFKTESIKQSFSAPGIKAVSEKLDYLKMTPEERKAYDAYRDMIHYNRSSLATAIAEGEHRGRVEGRVEGKAEGRAEGESETQRGIARTMLKMGLAIEVVSQATGISETEVKSIRERMATG